MFNFIMAWLRTVICPTVPKEPRPDIQVLEISRTQLARSIDKDTDIKSVLYGYLDRKYYYCSFEDWGKVLEYIYMVEQPPEWLRELEPGQQEQWDCDKWAKWLNIMISYHFGLNAHAIVIGDIPRGKHAFNMFYAEDGWWLWEPQLGDNSPFREGEKGYLPLHILI